jgi:riboflavin synthase alpha subunit
MKSTLKEVLLLAGRFDGHIVQGHVDQTAECIKVEAIWTAAGSSTSVMIKTKATSL